MATTIVRINRLTISDDETGVSEVWGNKSESRDQTNDGRAGNPGIIQLTAAEEDVSFGELGTPYEVLLENLSATETVYYGPKSGGAMIPFGQIAPGRTASVDFDQATPPTLRMKATDAADCRIRACAV
jgi:hypothetical protein